MQSFYVKVFEHVYRLGKLGDQIKYSIFTYAETKAYLLKGI